MGFLEGNKLIYMTLYLGKETAFDKKEVLVEVSSSFFEKQGLEQSLIVALDDYQGITLPQPQ